LLQTNFTAIDWAIVVLYLLGSLGIGVIAFRYIGRMSDFLVAGRQVRLGLLIATMTGTEIGLVTLMYCAQEGFSRGLSGFHIGLVEFVCYGFVGFTGFIVFRLRREGVMTIPEYYERRYSRPVRVVGGVILALAGILNFGMFLRAGAQFVAGVTGTVSPTTINWIMTGLLILVLLYTTLGGMVSVVITDYVQFVVMSLGLAIATYFSLAAVGGWGRMVEAGAAVRGRGFLDPFAQEGYGLSYVVWMVLVSVSAATMWMPAVMRCLSAQSAKMAKRVYVWTSISFLTRRVLPAVWGACALVFIAGRPALRALFLEAPEGARTPAVMAMPVFLGHIVPTGLLGLLVAGMLAGFMSTHDSYLLAWAGVITQDIVSPLRRGALGDRARVALTRFLIVAIGVFLLIWGLWYPLRATLWDYMALTGTVYFAGALPVLVGGLYWRRASSRGAMISLLAGLFALLALVDRNAWLDSRGVPILPQWWDKRTIALFTFALAAFLMIVGSLLFPDKAEREEKETEE